VGDAHVLVPGHGSICGANQVHARIDSQSAAAALPVTGAMVTGVFNRASIKATLTSLGV
jgi:hypothetical protein